MVQTRVHAEPLIFKKEFLVGLSLLALVLFLIGLQLRTTVGDGVLAPPLLEKDGLQLGNSGSAKAPMVLITSPVEGAVLSDSFIDVTFEMIYWELGSFGNPHLGVYLNGKGPYEMYGGSFSKVFNQGVYVSDIQVVDENTLRFFALTPGAYELELVLIDAQGAQYSQGSTVTFSVVGSKVQPVSKVQQQEQEKVAAKKIIVTSDVTTVTTRVGDSLVVRTGAAKEISVTYASISQQSVVLALATGEQIVVATDGAEETIDLDGDGVADVALSVTSLSSGEVQTNIHNFLAPTSESAQNAQSPLWLVSIVIAIILGVAAVLFYVFRIFVIEH